MVSSHTLLYMQSVVESISNPSSHDILARGEKMCEVRMKTLDGAGLAYPRHTDGETER